MCSGNIHSVMKTGQTPSDNDRRNWTLQKDWMDRVVREFCPWFGPFLQNTDSSFLNKSAASHSRAVSQYPSVSKRATYAHILHSHYTILRFYWSMYTLRDDNDLTVSSPVPWPQGDDDLLTVYIGEIFLEFVNMLPAFQTYCLQQSTSVNMLNTLEKEKELLRCMQGFFFQLCVVEEWLWELSLVPAVALLYNS